MREPSRVSLARAGHEVLRSVTFLTQGLRGEAAHIIMVDNYRAKVVRVQ